MEYQLTSKYIINLASHVVGIATPLPEYGEQFSSGVKRLEQMIVELKSNEYNQQELRDYKSRIIAITKEFGIILKG